MIIRNKARKNSFRAYFTTQNNAKKVMRLFLSLSRRFGVSRRCFSRKPLRNDIQPDTVMYVGEGDLAGCATVHSYQARVGDAFRMTHPSSNLFYYGVTVNVWADVAWVRILDNQVATKGDAAVLLKDETNTRQPWAFPVGSELLGHVLDPNFRPVSQFDTKQVTPSRFATISTWQPAIADRKRITQSIHTGSEAAALFSHPA